MKTPVYNKEQVMQEIRTIHDKITHGELDASNGNRWNDMMHTLMLERDRYKETLEWLSNTLDKSITENDQNETRLILDGEYHTGPVVDWVHGVLTGIKEISDKTMDM